IGVVGRVALVVIGGGAEGVVLGGAGVLCRHRGDDVEAAGGAGREDRADVAVGVAGERSEDAVVERGDRDGVGGGRARVGDDVVVGHGLGADAALGDGAWADRLVDGDAGRDVGVGDGGVIG